METCIKSLYTPTRTLLVEAAMELESSAIYCGDCLEVLPKYVPDSSVDLIYIDPPFNTNRRYETFWGEQKEARAFEDRHGRPTQYLKYMAPRLHELYRVLKPGGGFWYHCDWHISHYIKVWLDEYLFGIDNFRNEVYWYYYNKMHDRRKGQFPRATDSLLFYVKDADKVPYTFHPEPEKRESPVQQLARKKVGGKMVNVRDDKGKLVYRVVDTKTVDNVWRIPYIVPASSERLGYPTQKPMRLLRRIVETCSNAGDVVLDAFCGCGTTLEVASLAKRRWVGIDISPTACRVMGERLTSRLGLIEGVDFRLVDMPKTKEELLAMPPFEFENWAVVALQGLPNRTKVGDLGIDGRLYPSSVPKETYRGVGLEGQTSLLASLDVWYPIQVKQRQAGRPDIDNFETAMHRDKRTRGYFVAFTYSKDALIEVRRAEEDGLLIMPLTVDDVLIKQIA